MLYSFQKHYEANIGSSNTTIYNSYKIRHIDEMVSIINHLRKKFPEASVSKRSLFTLINEWRTHNLLYDLGIYRNRTKDVDLDMKTNNIIYKCCYFVGSLLYVFDYSHIF